MRLFYSMLQTRAASFVSFVAVGLIASAAMPRTAWSQGATTPPAENTAQAQTVLADSIIEACYVVSTGVVYLIKEPGLKTYCATQRHVHLSWRTSGAGIPGPIGPIGPAGLIGPAGATGVAGANGADGAIGPQGPAGPIGPIGPVGPAGANGAAGAVGPQGPIGPPGATGATGANGVDGAVGPQGPVGATGLIGPAG